MMNNRGVRYSVFEEYAIVYSLILPSYKTILIPSEVKKAGVRYSVLLE